MGIFQSLKREFFHISELRRITSVTGAIDPESNHLTPDMIEETVDKYRDRPAIILENGNITFAAFDAYANRVANWALSEGLQPGDTVALYMGNRWEYIAIWYGLSKVGVITAMLNNQVTGQVLAHGLNISEGQYVITEQVLVENYRSACDIIDCKMNAWVIGGGSADIPNGQDLDAALDTMSADRPDREIRAHILAKDPCLKMYTSGTTGLPKAAIVAHTRAMYYLSVFSTAARTTPDDRMMMVLPLYHATGGLCGVGAALRYGAGLIIRRKFSASAFWTDAVNHGATMFMYVGELCRFLVAADPSPLEKKHKIRIALGNGLRPDVWPRFVERTGIPRIMEFYGATEGNVGLVNIDSTPGAIGRVPPLIKFRFNIELVRFDLDSEEPVRDENGRCIKCEPGEVGEAIGKIDPDDVRYRFDGYGDKEATEKKILRDAFKEGDAWFRTGDLMKRDKHGYYYFVDRIGDTFRWKSENVSTNEVSEVMGHVEGVVQANVYGVPVGDYTGKAGMAALNVDADFDLEGLHRKVHEDLPTYARPLFIRIHDKGDAEHSTGTFKMKKTDLVKQGWDPDEVSDRLYIDHPDEGRYVELTPEIRDSVLNGDIRV